MPNQNAVFTVSMTINDHTAELTLETPEITIGALDPIEVPVARLVEETGIPAGELPGSRLLWTEVGFRAANPHPPLVAD